MFHLHVKSYIFGGENILGGVEISNEPVAEGIYKKFGLDPELLKNPHELDFREWCKHMREKSETEEKLT